MALARRAIIVAAGVLGYLGIAEIQFACGGGSPIPHFDRPDGPGHSPPVWEALRRGGTDRIAGTRGARLARIRILYRGME